MTDAPAPLPGSAQDPTALFTQAVAAIAAKDRLGARQLLATLVLVDPRHEEGWLLLSTLMDNVAQSIECLQHVIAINPAHAKARHWLHLARDSQTRAAESEPDAEPVPEPPMDDPAAFTELEPADRPVPRLGRYLLDFGFLTPEQLAAGLAAQADSAALGQPRLLGDILLAQTVLTLRQRDFALREQARLRAEVARPDPESALH